MKRLFQKLDDKSYVEDSIKWEKTLEPTVIDSDNSKADIEFRTTQMSSSQSGLELEAPRTTSNDLRKSMMTAKEISEVSHLFN